MYSASFWFIFNHRAAEAYLLMKQYYSDEWIEEEWLEFEENNSKYQAEAPSMNYVKRLLDYPKYGEGKWFQPKEILNHLVLNRIVVKEDIQKLNEV